MPAPMMHTSTSSGSSSDTQPAPSSFSSEEIADAEKRLVLRDGRERTRRDTPRGDARAADVPRAHVVAGTSALDIADERRAGRHPNRASGCDACERSEAAKEFLSSRFIGREDRDRCYDFICCMKPIVFDLKRYFFSTQDS